MTILVIEDKEADQQLAIDALNLLYHNECTVLCAASISYAKQVLRQRAIDLVILDLTFPSHQAHETWYEIEPLIPAHKIIIRSAYLDRPLMLPLIHAGARYFVDKAMPVMLSEEDARGFAIEAIHREILKATSIHAREHKDPVLLELQQGIETIKAQQRQLDQVLYRGNGEAMVTQLRVTQEAIADIRRDIEEMKPQVSAYTQERVKAKYSLVEKLAMGLLIPLSMWIGSMFSRYLNQLMP